MNIDVSHIAKLAKLRIDGDGSGEFSDKLRDVLNMVENLPALDGECGLVNADASKAMLLRPDEIGQSLLRDELLSNAPQKQAGCIVVPKTVG